MINSTKNNIIQIRSFLEKEEIDGFIIPHEDEFLTEYIPKSSERLAWATGFTGSAGLSIITKDSAVIFVDGRYTTQVKMECSTSLFNFENLDPASQENWVERKFKGGERVGFSPKTLSLSKYLLLKKIFDKKSIALVETKNIIDKIWLDRPKEPSGLVIHHSIEFSGKSCTEKFHSLVKELTDEKADSLFISESENTCWLLNIRGNDLDYTPVLRCFAIFEKNAKTTLFSNHNTSAEIEKHFNKNNITHMKIGDIEKFIKIKNYKKTIFDPKTTPLEIAKIIKLNTASQIQKSNPCSLMKACKNSTEINGSKNAHLRDGVALTRFLFWLSSISEKDEVDELTVENKLLEFRKENKELKSLSFNTIAGTAENAAIVHYKANKKTNKILRRGDLLLLDSGGQYFDGTTDVTRTVAVLSGEKDICDEKKDRFTRVLKGHIAIASSIFIKGTKGSDLDPLARKYLLEVGLNYSHGTGHGVGSFLGVHEGPQNISPSGTQEIKKGMIISNEPGYYKENEYGIRIENLVFTKESSDNNKLLYFETLTLSPIDKTLIDLNLMNTKEKKWLNDYHQEVCRSLSPFLNKDEVKWLKKSCEPIR